MPESFTESIIEQAGLAWLRSIGYSVLFGPYISPEEPAAERAFLQSITSEPYPRGHRGSPKPHEQHPNIFVVITH